MKYNLILLFVIVLVAGFLRIYKIGVNPPALSWDEVSIGYNAYSILKTGRDEHGKFFPLDTFVAYGDYKPPLSIYATVPFVAIFGLNEFSVRLPSAIAGTLTVLFTFFLVFELFQTFHFALLTSLLLAISPWHIQISRAGFEANIALMFVVLGVYLVVAAGKKPALWTVSFLPFVAAVYTFNSARYFAPFLLLGLFVFVKNTIITNIGRIMTGVVVAAVFLLPIIGHLASKEARLRFTEVNIFSDPGIVITSNNRMEQDGNTLASRIFDNRRVGYARSYLIHFFDHFDPQFLFVRGDGNPKFSTQDVGQLYLIEFPLIIAGVYWILRNHRSSGLFLLYWLITAIIPAAVARETPHALRIENSLPTWQLFTAAGILWFISLVKFKTGRRVLTTGIIVLYIFSVSYYLHNYYVHYPTEFSGEWQYGYKQAFEFIQPIKSSYSRVFITESIGRPYMYMLFYQKYDPDTFRRTKTSFIDAAGFYHVKGFDMYEFVGDEGTKFLEHGLYIMPPGSSPKGAKMLTIIKKLNGDPSLEIYSL